jgi:CheY-like chemotaxis protein/uncharacterized protein YbaR (Trm112 family)
MISAAPTHNLSRLRLVLLVDRDDDTREMYAEYLTGAGIKVQQAADGRDALARVTALPPDLIVTETRLPGLDGYELCALLRSDAKTRAIPIVVVTGDGYQADVSHAHEAGADLVLIKPCLPEVLLEEMRQLTKSSGRRAAVPRSKKPAMSRAGKRDDTQAPPATPPVLACPVCHQFLVYQRSHVGDADTRLAAEQFDYYDCPAGCGVFQYRQRTQALRRV